MCAQTPMRARTWQEHSIRSSQASSASRLQWPALGSSPAPRGMRPPAVPHASRDPHPTLPGTTSCSVLRPHVCLTLVYPASNHAGKRWNKQDRWKPDTASTATEFRNES